jgi:predicted ATPase
MTILYFLENLGFEIIIKNSIWKLGTRWGNAAPSFYQMLISHGLVIGTIHNDYSVGDIILITDGFTVISLAKITEHPVEVIELDYLKEEFLKYKIDYEDWVFSYKADFIELRKNEIFNYSLQAGIRQVRNQTIINTAINIWENRDVDYKKFIFYSKSYQKSPSKDWFYPCFVLEKRVSWNDYGNYISFELYFYNDYDNRELIGPIKILEKNSSNTVLKDSFEKLDSNFCSLGQAVEYYKLIIEKFPNTFGDILTSLNDLAYNKELSQDFKEDSNFGNLIRTSEAEIIYTDFENTVINKSIIKKIEFEFEILLSGAIKEHKAKIHFDSESILKNRFFCIVGKNATGKTKFLSSLANKLADNEEQGNFIPERPDFAKIITSTFSYFDKFRIPRSRDTNYNFIGIRENGELLKEDKFSDYLWNSYRRLISDYEKKEFYFECLKSSLEVENLNFRIEDLNVKSKSEFLQKTGDIFSSGQNIVFQFITRFIECIEFNSLLIFDEPETHLHPNITGRLISTINLILEKFNSFCIVSTHSPVVVQEMKSKDILIFDRQNNFPLVYKPSIECFGENLTVISNDIFKVDEEKELYKKELDNLLNLMNYEQILKIFDNKLSLNAMLYLRQNFNRND